MTRFISLILRRSVPDFCQRSPAVCVPAGGCDIFPYRLDIPRITRELCLPAFILRSFPSFVVSPPLNLVVRFQQMIPVKMPH
jgi:hypothetical protein